MRLYEFYTDEWYYYIVTEYCEGGDLLTMLTEKREISEREAARIMRQILAAVEYCHRKKIVHRYIEKFNCRDLKPENIVFEKKNINSTLKIIDFGRSKFLQAKSHFTDQTGSVIKNNTLVLLHIS